jgi:hypothetical protein
MVQEFPPLKVEELMNIAARKAKTGVWSPTPPTSENVPTGAVLEHARRTARRLGLTR